MNTPVLFFRASEPHHNPISKAQNTKQSIMGVACVRHGSPIDFRYFIAVD